MRSELIKEFVELTVLEMKNLLTLEQKARLSMIKYEIEQDYDKPNGEE